MNSKPSKRRLSGLQEYEVSIIKRMRHEDLRRDYIFSFLSAPGRKLSPARISEVDNGQIGKDIPMASKAEMERFIKRKLNQFKEINSNEFQGPLSAVSIHEALNWFTKDQSDLLSDETEIVEFKTQFDSDKPHVLAYLKTMAAFSNHTGGYIFFGISKNRNVVGINESDFRDVNWDRFESFAREHFEPFFAWDKTLFEYEGKCLGVVYTVETRSKPIVCRKSYDNVLSEGAVYFRYRGKTEPIRAGDFRQMLSDRDEQIRRRAIGKKR